MHKLRAMFLTSLRSARWAPLFLVSALAAAPVAAQNATTPVAVADGAELPFGGATMRAPRHLGWGNAMRFLLTGEEFGAENTDAEHVWIIDPIDGTRSFISGVPLWGTLVGLTQNGDAIAGMMAQPFTGELFYANGTGAHYEGRGANARLSTRPTEEPSALRSLGT